MCNPRFQVANQGGNLRWESQVEISEKVSDFEIPRSHVGKYDRADDRPKLAMLAANVGYRYWTDDQSRLG